MNRVLIRFFDLIFSLTGLLVLSPVFLFVAAAVKTGSPGPVFFRQSRVGKDGRDFTLFKFRTMIADAESKGQITVGARDARITGTGRWLRKYKLDELPQLYNVLIADMSLVGPRPEVRKYVVLYNAEQRKVLNVKPGITDLASVKYADENEILARSEDPMKMYVEKVMPDKILLNMDFIDNPSVSNYFRILFMTFRRLISG